ncbi:MAG TPA: hypothetical protein VK889_07175 [Solirubrobacterales bacterium]|nr:hypothetical protein [Solirubrobacterales bacterium]
MLAVHLVLTALPGIGAALFAGSRGVRNVPVLLAVALAGSGVVAYLAFWLYYADPVLGEAFSYFTAFGAAGLTAWGFREGWLDLQLLRPLATPLALWALGSAFIVFLGFMHGGTDEALGTAGRRFTAEMPADNYLPFFFAEWFFQNGHHGSPSTFPGDWLASDRPPLQIGYVLAQKPLQFWDNELNYQVLGVILQQLWIVGLWALLLAARVGQVTRGLAMLVVLVSDLAIVNGFFVWPKMLPVGFLLAVAAIVLTPLWPQLRSKLWAGALVGGLLALAMLCHGSSLFGAIPLAVIALLRGFPGWRWLGVAALVGVALMAPWSAYQKWGEPPGNRLIKLQIGGITEVDERGVTEALVDSYREVGFGGALHNKGQNFVTMAGGALMADHLENAVEAVDAGESEYFVEEIRNVFFFNLFPAFGLLLFAPLVMLAGWRRRGVNPAEWSLALTCFAVVAIGAVAWGLLLFGDAASRTVIHQGTFLLPVLGFCGAVVGLRAVFPRFALWYAGIAATLMFAFYVPALNPPEGSSYSLLAGFAAAASLVGFALVGFAHKGGAAPGEDRQQG